MKIKKCLLAILTACSLTACQSYKTVTANVKEKVNTMFYDFTVNDCYRALSMNDKEPGNGNAFVVVNVTITNTYKDALTLTDHHFQLQTLSDSGSEEETASTTTTEDTTYVYPKSSEYLEDELPSEYTLQKDETKTGTLVFEIDATETVFNFCSADYFGYSEGDVSTGNTYFVQITPGTK